MGTQTFNLYWGASRDPEAHIESSRVLYCSMPARAIRLCGRPQTSTIPNEVSTGMSGLRRENDHVSNVGDDGSALSEYGEY